jgi:hypothetical protein
VEIKTLFTKIKIHQNDIGGSIILKWILREGVMMQTGFIWLRIGCCGKFLVSTVMNSMKSSWAISHIRCLYKTNVLRTILVPIIRDLEMFVLYRYLMQLIA